MTKAELIDAVAKDSKLSKADAGRAIGSFVDTISGALAQGDTVTMVGFGTFSVSARASRKGRNPQTGNEITIPASKVPRFKPGKFLKEKVNK